MIIYSRFNCLQKVIEAEPDTKYFYPGHHYLARQKMLDRRFDETWLTHRLELFEQFTYPSVVAQTDQNFEWRGLVHKDSPSWFIEALARFDRMKTMLVEMDTDAVVRGEPSANLDSDDALGKNYVKTIRLIDFNGEICLKLGAIHRIDPEAWSSMYTDFSHFNAVKHKDMTILDFNHGRGIIPKLLIKNEDPLWLEVYHGFNVSNLTMKHAYRRVPYAYICDHFALNRKRKVVAKLMLKEPPAYDVVALSAFKEEQKRIRDAEEQQNDLA